jgi:ORF6N domain
MRTGGRDTSSMIKKTHTNRDDSVTKKMPKTSTTNPSSPPTDTPAIESIALSIATLRGQRVIVDTDLATLYGVPAKRLNEQVKRNAARFPPDFMFRLSDEEVAALRSQNATLKTGRGQHRKYLPYVFTEHGAIMAATVLSSERAVEVSLYVVRAFVRLRQASKAHDDLAGQLAELQEKTELLAMQHDSFSRNTRNQLRQVFDALRELTAPPEPVKRPIGFVHPNEGKDGGSARRANKK